MDMTKDWLHRYPSGAFQWASTVKIRLVYNKSNNKITEHRAIFQSER